MSHRSPCLSSRQSVDLRVELESEFASAHSVLETVTFSGNWQLNVMVID